MNRRKNIQKNGYCSVVLNPPSCPLSCVFCPSSSQTLNSSESKESFKRAYKNLKHFKRAGFKKIEIGGNDSTEHDKIIRLVRKIKKHGFEFIQLSTNGTKLANSVFLDDLVSAGINRIIIPIYGSNAKIHDSVTQAPGSFNKTIRGIKNILNKKTVQLKTHCLLLRQNKNDWLSIVNLINNLGIKELDISIPQLNVDDCSSFYVPLKNLRPAIKRLYNHVMKTNNNFIFYEIPFCVFGEFNTQNIKNLTPISNLGKHKQDTLSEKYRSSKSNLPSYRLKKKTGICKGCRASGHCDGFFVNDIDRFGTGKLQRL